MRSPEDHWSLWMVRDRLQGREGSTSAGVGGGNTPGGRGGNKLRQVEGGEGMPALYKNVVI